MQQLNNADDEDGIANINWNFDGEKDGLRKIHNTTSLYSRTIGKGCFARYKYQHVVPCQSTMTYFLVKMQTSQEGEINIV